MNLEQLDRWAFAAKYNAEHGGATLRADAAEQLELIDYARERAAREACEALLLPGEYLSIETDPPISIQVEGPLRVGWVEPLLIMARAPRLTLTDSFLALRDTLEATR
jgi:hypothetical protein